MKFRQIASDIVQCKPQCGSQKKNGSFLPEVQTFLKIKKIQDEPSKNDI